VHSFLISSSSSATLNSVVNLEFQNNLLPFSKLSNHCLPICALFIVTKEKKAFYSRVLLINSVHNFIQIVRGLRILPTKAYDHNYCHTRCNYFEYRVKIQTTTKPADIYIHISMKNNGRKELTTENRRILCGRYKKHVPTSGHTNAPILLRVNPQAVRESVPGCLKKSIFKTLLLIFSCQDFMCFFFLTTFQT
jgi:hypothetical protein